MLKSQTWCSSVQGSPVVPVILGAEIMTGNLYVTQFGRHLANPTVDAPEQTLIQHAKDVTGQGLALGGR